MRLHERYADPPRAPVKLPPDIALKDPVTRKPYSYDRIDAKTYTLCAVFGAASEHDTDNTVYAPVDLARNWRHNAGRTCYAFDVTLSTISPQRR
jgi:hypothetical protein